MNFTKEFDNKIKLGVIAVTHEWLDWNPVVELVHKGDYGVIDDDCAL